LLGSYAVYRKNLNSVLLFQNLIFTVLASTLLFMVSNPFS